MKLCFVTVGATASFETLLEQVLTSEFLETLADRDYTHLLLQYGKDGEKIYNNFLQSGVSHHGLTLGGFDFKPSIEPEMVMTTEREKPQQERGLVICHAGSGTVLAGLRLGVPLIVVPNTELADNHQQELADILEQDNYAVSSTVQDLPKAIAQAELQKSEDPPFMLTGDIDICALMQDIACTPILRFLDNWYFGVDNRLNDLQQNITR